MADARDVIKRGIMHCLMGVDSDGIADVVMERLAASGLAIVPVEPTEAMLNAARDWSVAKYGRGVGNDGAAGCWQAMLRASQEPGDE